MVMDPHQVQCTAFFAIKDTALMEKPRCAVMKRDNGMVTFLYVQGVRSTLNLLLDYFCNGRLIIHICFVTIATQSSCVPQKLSSVLVVAAICTSSSNRGKSGIS